MGSFRINFGGITIGVGLLRAYLADLLFVLVLVLLLVCSVVRGALLPLTSPMCPHPLFPMHIHTVGLRDAGATDMRCESQGCLRSWCRCFCSSGGLFLLVYRGLLPALDGDEDAWRLFPR